MEFQVLEVSDKRKVKPSVDRMYGLYLENLLLYSAFFPLDDHHDVLWDAWNITDEGHQECRGHLLVGEEDSRSL